MRSSRPLLARSNMAAATATQQHPNPNPANIPSIRLISATPSASGISSDASTSFNRSLEQTWSELISQPSPLAPKPRDEPPRKKVVPKKSKLNILSIGRDKEKDRNKDLSDVVRRVGAPVTGGKGFEIYVDPTVDPDLGEIVIVKKKKSRAGLDDLSWGALGNVTNLPKTIQIQDSQQKENSLKVKSDEEKKWWTIGRGRKDSKEKKKTKENKISVTLDVPDRALDTTDQPGNPLKHDPEPRGRFNSLDADNLIHDSIPETEPNSDRARSTTPTASTFLRSSTPTVGGLLAPPGQQYAEDKSGSIAVRAIRSMRSLARMGSWAYQKNSPTTEEMSEELKKTESESDKQKDVKQKEGTVKEKKKKKKDGSEKEKKSEDTEKKRKEKNSTVRKSVKGEKSQTPRASTSSFEVGHLSASPQPISKKHSILGLGLPSTMRLPRMRGGSTASSLNLNVPGSSSNHSSNGPSTISQVSGTRTTRLSADNIVPDRPNSVASSNGSSLRPVSVASSGSRLSTGSSVVSAGTSVKWDEHGLETVREQRKKEREERRLSEDVAEKTERRTSRESRRSSEGRRRTPLSSVFPEVQHHQIGMAVLDNEVPYVKPADSDAASTISTNTISSSMRARRRSYGAFPILTIEEATSDGHAMSEEESAELECVDEVDTTTPVKRRVRPMSEQLLGRVRPKAIHEDDEGVLSILSAATNDLALLINTLDLQATPSTPDMTPLKASHATPHLEVESPLMKTLKRQMSSLASLRPYAQSRGSGVSKSSNADGSNSVTKKLSQADLLGQQIAPWPVLIAAVSPTKTDKPIRTPTNALSPVKAFKKGHKRTMTPGPEPEPEPTLQPLKPPSSKAPTRKYPTKLSVDVQSKDNESTGALFFASETFGKSSSSSIVSELASSTGSLTPVFQRIQAWEDKKRSSSPLGQIRNNSLDVDGRHLGDSFDDVCITVPMAKKGRKTTLGGSDISIFDDSQLDTSDPDIDVPDELKYILAGHPDKESVPEDSPLPAADSERASNPDATSQPQGLPVFRLTLSDDPSGFATDHEGTISSEDDTKKSFDFTGEIRKLNDGGSDRASFVEQLEIAFKTPAKMDLCYDFGGMEAEVPPLPPMMPLAPGVQAGMTSDTSLLGIEYPSQTQLLDLDLPSTMPTPGTIIDSQGSSNFDDMSVSQLMDVRELTHLGSTTFDRATAENTKEEANHLSRSTGSTRSTQTDGELDRSFRFGGRPKLSPSRELTLSDIIPPPECARALSEASMLDDFGNDSVVRSIYAKLMGKQTNDLCSRDDSASYEVDDVQKGVSRPASGVSFAGLESFDEVRRGFEFSGDRSFYPPPTRANRRARHRRDESAFSIASVSSFGRVLNNGVNDPFDYGLPSLRERPSSEDISGISMSMSIDDTFAFIRNQPRQRVDSDASSFYFRSGTHKRGASSISISSQAPPISIYNRSFGNHRKNDSSASCSSIAISYAKHGANSGMSAWARHRKDISVESTMSDFSVVRLGRPGIGDKMFDNAVDLGPLTSISASPPDGFEVSESAYDSILDDEVRSGEDSLFEMTGQRSSMSSDSVFGDDNPHMGNLLPPIQFRPLSVHSLDNSHGPINEDDTMISMLGGGHVRRRSLISMMEASPCIRMEKRTRSAMQKSMKAFKNVEGDKSPNKPRIVEKSSIASASSFQFGNERMIHAQQGLLERQSLEDSCFIADGEDISGFCMPVFTRNLEAGSRSSTCTSSSGVNTPPLSCSDGSSMSESSPSSIDLDLAQLNIALTNATHPLPSTRPQARIRARGHGHRRRYSRAHVSRSSVYETIEEEATPSPPKSLVSRKDDVTTSQPVFIVDSDTVSVHSKGEEGIWYDEQGIVALRRFYALRDEAENTVSESKRTWIDTPFSLFALQSFQPPNHPAGMRALLEHSVQSYGPLPSELRSYRVRSRTSSRPSPYPASRISKSSLTTNASKDNVRKENSSKLTPVSVLRDISTISNISAAPMLDTLKPFSPLVMNSVKVDKVAKDVKNPAVVRPRVGSTARRTALGWSKRSTGKSTAQKENVTIGNKIGKENFVATGTTTTPGDTLRLSRPRPRGRTPGGRTPASQNRSVRV